MDEENMEIKRSEAIKELERCARSLHAVTEELDKTELRELDPTTRAELAKVFQDIVTEAKLILEVLITSCVYCREVGGESLGHCVQCGREVCSFCGRMVDGKPLHSSVCALWYKQNNHSRKEE